MSTQLIAEKREQVGTRHSRKLRSLGRIPASVQGQDAAPNIDISVDEDVFLAARRHHEHVFDIEIEGAHETALVNELHWDVFGEKILHVEFRRVDLHKETAVEVEIVFDGHPKGILNHIITHVTLMAKPQDIPDSVELKVDGLEPGTHLTVGELVLPEGVTLGCEPETAVANISELKVAEEPTEAEVEGEEAATAPAEGAETPDAEAPPETEG